MFHNFTCGRPWQQIGFDSIGFRPIGFGIGCWRIKVFEQPKAYNANKHQHRVKGSILHQINLIGFKGQILQINTS